ncbi:MAG: 16S rRNA (cytidine(1402)-2'-O)-methyltransferase [Firmicutes bacterium]|nr:16S rRNA (cytidine(1402)-2'-O)-methyltransferase [Candidatus Fiminaster equi]
MRSLNFDSTKPLLYLVSTPIGNMQEVSPRTLEVLSSVDLIACEDTRVTGKLLQILGISKNLVSIREHNEVSSSQEIVKKILAGTKVAYMSDAGYPCISDPGAKLVKICLENEINVTTISGPNAALNALCASGLCGDHFYFHGFLSAKESERLEELRNLHSRKETLIFYEAPHRISKTLQSLFDIFGNRKACIARELTKKHEEFIRMSLEEMLKLDPETLKGEMVIVVEGSNGEEQPIIGDNDIINMVKTFVESGMSTKDAIKKVSEMTQVNKNHIYKLVHLN